MQRRETKPAAGRPARLRIGRVFAAITFMLVSAFVGLSLAVTYGVLDAPTTATFLVGAINLAMLANALFMVIVLIVSIFHLRRVALLVFLIAVEVLVSRNESRLDRAIVGAAVSVGGLCAGHSDGKGLSICVRNRGVFGLRYILDDPSDDVQRARATRSEDWRKLAAQIGATELNTCAQDVYAVTGHIYQVYLWCSDDAPDRRSLGMEAGG